jgi:hypothetical protein
MAPARVVARRTRLDPFALAAGNREAGAGLLWGESSGSACASAETRTLPASQRTGRATAGQAATFPKISTMQRSTVPHGDANLLRSIPETWVTPYSGDMGNSFGPKGLLIGSRRHVSSSKYPKS